MAGDDTLSVTQISHLFNARGGDFMAVCQAADRLRKSVCGDTVSYVINRNINYTNICTFRCHFCAFAKGRKNTPASDAPYLKSPLEVAQLAREAWQRGATEVCMQGGIHPSFTGQTYIDICSAVKAAVPAVPSRSVPRPMLTPASRQISSELNPASRTMRSFSSIAFVMPSFLPKRPSAS